MVLVKSLLAHLYPLACSGGEAAPQMMSAGGKAKNDVHGS